MTNKTTIQMTLNGQLIQAEVEPRQHLVDFLREDQSLTGSHLGCEQGACGACTVKMNGQIVRGCLVLAVQEAKRVWQDPRDHRPISLLWKRP
jgi:carbon-monoxide dehydrogenase small subunit